MSIKDIPVFDKTVKQLMSFTNTKNNDATLSEFSDSNVNPSKIFDVWNVFEVY